MGKKELEQKILEHNARESARKEKIRQNAEKQKQKEKEFWDNENSKLSEKKEIVGKVMAWRDDFIKNDTFREYIKGGLVDIFGSQYGHVPEEGGFGCWSYIRIEESGQLEYYSGYKYFGIRGKISEERFAGKLTYNYLSKLLSHIESGKVYETIGNGYRLKRVIERLSKNKNG